MLRTHTHTHTSAFHCTPNKASQFNQGHTKRTNLSHQNLFSHRYVYKLFLWERAHTLAGQEKCLYRAIE